MNLRDLYPSDPVARRRTMTGDAVVVGLLVLFLVLALSLRDAVGDFGQMGAGIAEAGEALRESGRDTAGEVRGAFDEAADVAASLPLVGGELADSLRETGNRNAAVLERQSVATGTDLARSGRQGEKDAARVGDLIGLLSFLVPAALLLAQTLPRRLRQIRELR